MLDGQVIKLFGGRVANAGGTPGAILGADETLRIAASVGALEVAEVQPAGKQRMPVPDWVRGRGAVVGQHFA
jgi:methionyl-tRNA formyltransferase